jgi:hypothetical protein
MVAREEGNGGLSPLSEIDVACLAHRARFGICPEITVLLRAGRDAELVELIQDAVRFGKPLDCVALARAWGCTPLLPGTEP